MTHTLTSKRLIPRFGIARTAWPLPLRLRLFRAAATVAPPLCRSLSATAAAGAVPALT